MLHGGSTWPELVLRGHHGADLMHCCLVVGGALYNQRRPPLSAVASFQLYGTMPPRVKPSKHGRIRTITDQQLWCFRSTGPSCEEWESCTCRQWETH